MGRVLFLDEAYHLYRTRDSNRDDLMRIEPADVVIRA
jgi:hypothetical protein